MVWLVEVRVIFEDGEEIKIGDSIEITMQTFEEIEKGSGKKLRDFLKECKENYDLAVSNMLYKMPGKSVFELINYQHHPHIPAVVAV